MPFRCLGPLVALLALPALVFAQTRTRPLDPQAAAEARQGWRAIEAGRAADAFGHFDAALARDPDVAPYQFGAGLAAYLLGRPEVARGRLEDALRLEPALTAASVLLGEILHQAGDLEGAIGVYEAARARAPADRQIAPRLDAWRAEASLQDSFQRSMSTNFTVLFEGPAEQPLAQKALELLETAYWAGPAPLVALLTDLGNQVPFPDAFSQRILIPYETFAADWAARVR